jgi:hypothetical protein
LHHWAGDHRAPDRAKARWSSAAGEDCRTTVGASSINIPFICIQSRITFATRGLALVPAVIVAGLSGAAGMGKLLVLSQFILGLQLPFAVLPFSGSPPGAPAWVSTRLRV